jgi:transcriptional antiterminator NusG
LDNWYVLSVKSGYEETVCEIINKTCNKDEYYAFTPRIKLRYKNLDNNIKIYKPMFQGYIFIKSNYKPEKSLTELMPIIKLSNCIIKLIGKDNLENMCLDTTEKDYILRFCDDKYLLKSSRGIIVGDKIIIDSGPLRGLESNIKKIDRHKRKALIELSFLGDIRKINVPLEIVIKVVDRVVN